MSHVGKAKWTAADSAGPTIASSVSDCLRSFETFLFQIRHTGAEASNPIEPSEVIDELGRFRVWAGNLGAHRKGLSSLDYRLRDASHIKSKVHSLLSDLNDRIKRALEILRGERVPWDQQRLGDDSDTDSTDSEAETHSLQGDTELRQLMSSIHGTTTLLLRLSMAIRNPAPHDQYMMSVDIQSSHFKQFDKSHVRNKFPEASEHLIATLGEANSRRREYFKYRELHNQKLSEGLSPSFSTANFNDDSETIAAQSTAASSIPQEVKTKNFPLDLEDSQSESGQTQTSFATSTAGEEGLKVPPIPKEAQDGNPFQCPFCFTIISVSTHRFWKKHVLRDLHPYSCTFPYCTSSKRLFGKRHEWFQHELHVHRKFWECIRDCQKQFLSQIDFKEHIQQRHPELKSPDKLAPLLALCERLPSPGSEACCELCGKNGITLRELEKHLGEHQEQIALFALPPIYDEERAESEGLDTDTEGSLGHSQSNHGGSDGMAENMANLSLTPGSSAANATYQQVSRESEEETPQDTYANVTRAAEKDQDYLTKSQDLSPDAGNPEIPPKYPYSGAEPTFYCCQCRSGPFLISLYSGCITCHHRRCHRCKIE